MEDCIFCKIVAGQSPVSLIYEDDLSIAFMDIQPVNPGHLLVIPKQHVTYWKDMDPQLAGHIFSQGIRLDNALRQTDLRCEGVNFFAADGEAAFQEVFHAHLHVIPRFKGDGFRLQFSDRYFQLPTRAALDQIAEAVKGKFEAL